MLCGRVTVFDGRIGILASNFNVSRISIGSIERKNEKNHDKNSDTNVVNNHEGQNRTFGVPKKTDDFRRFFEAANSFDEIHACSHLKSISCVGTGKNGKSPWKLFIITTSSSSKRWFVVDVHDALHTHTIIVVVAAIVRNAYSYSMLSNYTMCCALLQWTYTEHIQIWRKGARERKIVVHVISICMQCRERAEPQ